MSVYLATNNYSFSVAKIRLFFVIAYFFGILALCGNKKGGTSPPNETNPIKYLFLHHFIRKHFSVFQCHLHQVLPRRDALHLHAFQAVVLEAHYAALQVVELDFGGPHIGRVLQVEPVLGGIGIIIVGTDAGLPVINDPSVVLDDNNGNATWVLPVFVGANSHFSIAHYRHTRAPVKHIGIKEITLPTNVEFGIKRGKDKAVCLPRGCHIRVINQVRFGNDCPNWAYVRDAFVKQYDSRKVMASVVFGQAV